MAALLLAALVLFLVTASPALAGTRRQPTDAVYLTDSRWDGPVWPLLQADKRTLDFGVGRGLSGTLMAKHLMGLAAAADPNGPGRRR